MSSNQYTPAYATNSLIGFTKNERPSLDELRNILTYIDYTDRENWWKVGAIIGRAYDRDSSAYDVYQSWAHQYAERTPKDEKQEHTEFYSSSQKEGPGIGALINMAKANGYKPPKREFNEATNGVHPVVEDLPFIIREADANTNNQKMVIQDIKHLASSVLAYLMVQATTEEKISILSKYGTFGQYFPDTLGKLYDALKTYCKTHKETSHLDFIEWLKSLPETERYLLQDYEQAVKNGGVITYDTCLGFLWSIKNRYDCLFVEQALGALATVARSGDHAQMRDMIGRLYFKFTESSQYELFGKDQLFKLAAQEILDQTDPERLARRFIPTGFKELDWSIGGWAVGECSLIAAHTGVGKTWFAVDSALRANNIDEPVLFISTEMSGPAIAKRLFDNAMQNSRDDYNKVNALTESMKVYKVRIENGAPMDIMAGRSISIDDIESALELWKWRTEGQGRLVFVDYLQNIINEDFGNKVTATYERIKNTMERLVRAAAKYNCAIVALAQLNNPNQQGKQSSDNPRVFNSPNLYSLAGCTGAALDAAAVCTLYRVEPDNDGAYSQDGPFSDPCTIRTNLRVGAKEIRNRGSAQYRMDVVKSRYGSGEDTSFTVRRTRGGGFYTDKTAGVWWGFAKEPK